MIAALLARFGPWLALLAGALGWVKWRERQARADERRDQQAQQKIADAAAEIDRVAQDDAARRAGRDANVQWLRQHRGRH